jgi:hypothetical protein
MTIDIHSHTIKMTKDKMQYDLYQILKKIEYLQKDFKNDYVFELLRITFDRHYRKIMSMLVDKSYFQVPIHEYKFYLNAVNAIYNKIVEYTTEQNKQRVDVIIYRIGERYLSKTLLEYMQH